jgi:hypothetical protein
MQSTAGLPNPPPVPRRKEELAMGFQSVAGAQNLLAQYPREQVEENMLKYVVEGRAAMGPSFLKARCCLVPPSAALAACIVSRLASS